MIAVASRNVHQTLDGLCQLYRSIRRACSTCRPHRRHNDRIVLVANISKDGDLHMSTLMAARAILVILGVLGLAVPNFITSGTRDVVKVGHWQLQTAENTAHAIPSAAAGRALSIRW